MEGLKRRISFLFVLTAVILLVGVRSMPHHHGCVTLSSGEVVAVTHFGYGHCDDCEHSHCSDTHTHDHEREQCCDDTEYYSRLNDKGPELGKKSFVQPLVCIAVPQFVLAPQPGNASLGGSFYILKIPDRGVTFSPLRAPPVV